MWNFAPITASTQAADASGDFQVTEPTRTAATWESTRPADKCHGRTPSLFVRVAAHQFALRDSMPTHRRIQFAPAGARL